MKKIHFVGEKEISKIYEGKMISEFLSNFKRKVLDFHERLGENPLLYREKKLTSIVFPSLYEISSNLILEHEFGYNKKDGNKKSSSRYLDIWFADKKLNNVFLIELKQAWDYLDAEKLDTHTIDKWDGLKDQLDDLNLESLDTLGLSEDANIYSLGLYFMPTLYNSDTKVISEWDVENYFKEDKFKIFKDYDFHWTWKTPEKLNDNAQEDSNLAYFNIIGKLEKVN